MTAYFNRFIITMTMKQAADAAHIGDCTDDVKKLCSNRKIKEQLEQISASDLRDELQEYGAWDEAELDNREENEERVIWIAACNIMEG